MSTPVVKYQHDPTKTINYTGSDEEYWPDGGPVVLPTLHTARISGHELDSLEIASHGKVVFTTDGIEKALEIRGLGIADPAIIDTTVLDTGDNTLELKSDLEIKLGANNISLTGDSEYRSSIHVDNPSVPTFRHVATPAKMTLGTGVLDPVDKHILSGAFLETTANSFKLRHDTASISSSAADGRIRFQAAEAHELFVNSDASTQADGTGAIEILHDKVIIRKDVDLMGYINALTTDSSTLHVQDQVIRLAQSTDPALANRDELLALSKTGMSIDTAPGDYTFDGAYMSRFTGADGSKLFVSDNEQTINVTTAIKSGVFTKEVAYHLDQGAIAAGEASSESRLNEPYWNVTGGALHMSHTVPGGNGKARKFSLGFRIDDAGNVEMVRLTKNLEWDNTANKYTSDANMDDGAKVIAKYLNSDVATKPAFAEFRTVNVNFDQTVQWARSYDAIGFSVQPSTESRELEELLKQSQWFRWTQDGVDGPVVSLAYVVRSDPVGRPDLPALDFFGVDSDRGEKVPRTYVAGTITAYFTPIPANANEEPWTFYLFFEETYPNSFAVYRSDKATKILEVLGSSTYFYWTQNDVDGPPLTFASFSDGPNAEKVSISFQDAVPVAKNSKAHTFTKLTIHQFEPKPVVIVPEPRTINVNFEQTEQLIKSTGIAGFTMPANSTESRDLEELMRESMWFRWTQDGIEGPVVTLEFVNRSDEFRSFWPQYDFFSVRSDRGDKLPRAFVPGTITLYYTHIPANPNNEPWTFFFFFESTSSTSFDVYRSPKTTKVLEILGMSTRFFWTQNNVQGPTLTYASTSDGPSSDQVRINYQESVTAASKNTFTKLSVYVT